MTNDSAPRNIVVYADDDPDDLELIKEAFRQFANNVEVVTFENGNQALSYLQNLTDNAPLPCLIILDINMPVLSGKEVLVRLRQMEKYKAIPAILFTTSNMPSDKTFAQQHNAGFITKPLGLEQIESITRQFIERCSEEIRRQIKR